MGGSKVFDCLPRERGDWCVDCGLIVGDCPGCNVPLDLYECECEPGK